MIFIHGTLTLNVPTTKRFLYTSEHVTTKWVQDLNIGARNLAMKVVCINILMRIKVTKIPYNIPMRIKEIQMQPKTHLLLGPRNHSQLSIDLTHVDRYGYNENIKYWESMFPTCSLHGSQPCFVQFD